MTLKTGVFIALAATLVLVPLSGCLQDRSDEGRVAVYVRDQPTDLFASLHLTFEQAIIHRGPQTGNGSAADPATGPGAQPADNRTDGPGSGNVSDDGGRGRPEETPGGPADPLGGEPAGDEGSPLVDERGARDDALRQPTYDLMGSPREIDLLRFRGPGSRALLGTEWVAAGNYHAIDLVLGGAAATMTNGTEVELVLSVPEDTVRASEPFDVRAGETTRVIIDLDLDGAGVLVSQVVDGEARWSFHPRVRAVEVENGAEGPERDVTPDGAEDGATGGFVDVRVTGRGPVAYSELWVVIERVEAMRTGAAPGATVVNGSADGQDPADPFGREPNVPEGGPSIDAPDDRFGRDPGVLDEPPGAGETPDTAEPAPQDADGEWVTLIDAPRSVELLATEGAGVDGDPLGTAGRFIASAAVTPGAYSRVRVTLGEVWGIPEGGGQRQELELADAPICAAACFEVRSGERTELLLVVDLMGVAVDGAADGSGARVEVHVMDDADGPAGRVEPMEPMEPTEPLEGEDGMDPEEPVDHEEPVSPLPQDGAPPGTPESPWPVN